MKNEDEIQYLAHMLDEAMLDENHAVSLALKTLSEQFGDAFFDERRIYLPIVNDLELMFGTLNENEFSPRLKTVPIVISSMDEMKKHIQFAGEWYVAAFHRKLDIISHDGEWHFMTDPATWYVEVIRYKDGKTTIPFIVNALCHEMIHEFTYQHGHMLADLESQFNRRLKPDYHTSEFLTIAAKLNEKGFDIMDTISDTASYDEINANATKKAKSALTEAVEKFPTKKAFLEYLAKWFRENPDTIEARVAEDGVYLTSK